MRILTKWAMVVFFVLFLIIFVLTFPFKIEKIKFLADLHYKILSLVGGAMLLCSSKLQEMETGKR